VNLGILDTQFTDIYLSNASGYVAGSTEFREAPEITGNIGIQHDADLSNGGTFTTRFDYTYTDQYWRASDPTLRTGFNPSIPPGPATSERSTCVCSTRPPKGTGI
jgi:hypothetical protein